MELQDIFYVMAIVYMSIMFILMVAGLAIAVAIKRKIDAFHRSIEEKIHMITNITHVGSELVDKAKRAFKH